MRRLALVLAGLAMTEPIQAAEPTTLSKDQASVFAKLALKGGTNVTPPANAIMKFLALNDTLWVEVSRSF